MVFLLITRLLYTIHLNLSRDFSKISKIFIYKKKKRATISGHPKNNSDIVGVHCLLNSITNTTNQLKNPFRYCVRYKHNFVFSLYGCLYRTIRLHQSDRIMKIREQFNFIRLRMKSQLGHIFRTIISLRKL